jgi:hypothetical protein
MAIVVFLVIKTNYYFARELCTVVLTLATAQESTFLQCNIRCFEADC